MRMKSLLGVLKELKQLEASLPSQEAAIVAEFTKRLVQWREDDSSARVLLQDVESLMASAWFTTHEKRALLSLTIARLHDTIDALVGMTMNERLSILDLTDRWERTGSGDREVLYEKVLADPAKL